MGKYFVPVTTESENCMVQNFLKDIGHKWYGNEKYWTINEMYKEDSAIIIEGKNLLYASKEYCIRERYTEIPIEDFFDFAQKNLK